jgi:L-histidine Nalpha-methyltransferase
MTMPQPRLLSAAATGEARSAFAADVEYYLSQDPRQLPSRYLYDVLGSSLFEAICRLPWYSITRAEMRLLTSHAHEVFAVADPVRLVELGCGSGEKLATLLGGRNRVTRTLELHLIDMSSAALAGSMRQLDRFENVRVVTHQAPYEAGLADVGRLPGGKGRTLVLFLGSNIGNFDPPGADEFLREIRANLQPGDFFLLGVDLVKPAPILLAAYDDPLGVTAAFNRNLLVRVNREIGGNFDLGSFAHRAVWNEAASRVEMHLVSLRRQQVRITDARLEMTLHAGETIWTESSYKYEADSVVSDTERAGFSPAAEWIDEADKFALTLFRAV